MVEKAAYVPFYNALGYSPMHTLRARLDWHGSLGALCPLCSSLEFGGSLQAVHHPHMWLADGDSLMCYIVMMSRQIA